MILAAQSIALQCEEWGTFFLEPYKELFLDQKEKEETPSFWKTAQAIALFVPGIFASLVCFTIKSLVHWMAPKPSETEEEQKSDDLSISEKAFLYATTTLLTSQTTSQSKISSLVIDEPPTALEPTATVINVENKLAIPHLPIPPLPIPSLPADCPRDILWKIRKYEQQILELQKYFKEYFIDIEADSPIKSLYDILFSHPIDLFDVSRFSSDYLQKVRDAYNKEFLPALRTNLEQHPHDPLLQTAAELLFTKISLEAESLETLAFFDYYGHQMCKEGEFIPSLTLPTQEALFSPTLKRLYKRINEVPYTAKSPLLHQWANSARGQWNRDFDPYKQGNPVHRLYTAFYQGKEIIAIGCGSPTIEDYYQNSTINPEFIGFLRAYKSKQKKHLFVINQNTIPKSGLFSYFVNGDETNRCTSILQLQTTEEFKDTLFVIALSKNSPFYLQSGEYNEASKASLFKKNLFDQLFTLKKEESGCFIPDNIKTLIKEEAKKALEKIHEHLFESKEALTVEERLVFIEQYYDQILAVIIQKLDVDSFNISCKDAIDRGAASNAQFFSHLALTNGDISEAVWAKMVVFMMARALFVRKRAPLKERIERFTDVLDFSLQHKEKLRALNLELHPEGLLTLVP